MSNNYFKFKKFTIFQDKCAMKVSTDSVLLGSITSPPNLGKILDIGAGTGILSLMMAFKSLCHIDAIEIDSSAYNQALANVYLNKKDKQITVLNKDFKTFNPPYLYDLIITNPPYFEPGIPSKNLIRNIARCTTELTHRQLFTLSCRFLRQEGQLSLCIPYSSLAKIYDVIKELDLKVIKETLISAKKGNDYYLAILLLKKTNLHVKTIHEDLFIRDENSEYSPKYRQITSEYYLKF